jgi:RNA polymerase sigma factor (sigma-70 family)
MQRDEPQLTPEQTALIESELLPHLDSMFNFAMHLTRYDETESNDLVQESMFKACRSVSQYKEGTNAKAWLFTILKNTFINRYRQKSRALTTEDIDKHFFKGPSDDTPIPQAFVDLREDFFSQMIGDEVSNALNQLSPDFKTIIILCDLEEMSYEDISSVLGLPIGTVRSRIHRARNQLKNILREYGRRQGYVDHRE